MGKQMTSNRKCLHGYCPSCESGRLRQRGKAPWECRDCGHRFDMPRAEKLNAVPAVKRGGSGVIAGLTYRAQLARERLANSANVITEAKYYGRSK